MHIFFYVVVNNVCPKTKCLQNNTGYMIETIHIKKLFVNNANNNITIMVRKSWDTSWDTEQERVTGVKIL